MGDQPENHENDPSLPSTATPGLLATPVWLGPGSQPSADAPAASAGMPERRQVSLKLVSSEATNPCHFWIGLAKGGALNPALLLAEQSLSTVFQKAADLGLSDDGPVMLSDSELSPPRFIYLLRPPSEDTQATKQWLDELAATVKAWNPPTLGLYLSPDLLSKPQAMSLLQAILLRLVTTTTTAEYVLLLGQHGHARLLNATLQLKASLSSSEVELFVFH